MMCKHSTVHVLEREGEERERERENGVKAHVIFFCVGLWFKPHKVSLNSVEYIKMLSNGLFNQ